MNTFLTITALARETGVSSKALRHWEALGLLPKALRSASGYRRFPAEATAYVGFVQRSKDMGLTLQQMRIILKLARKGRSPCMEVESFIDNRIQELEEKITSLSALLQSLKTLQQCSADRMHPDDRSKECCCLLVGLPEGETFPVCTDVSDQPSSAQ